MPATGANSIPVDNPRREPMPQTPIKVPSSTFISELYFLQCDPTVENHAVMVTIKEEEDKQAPRALVLTRSKAKAVKSAEDAPIEKHTPPQASVPLPVPVEIVKTEMSKAPTFKYESKAAMPDVARHIFESILNTTIPQLTISDLLSISPKLCKEVVEHSCMHQVPSAPSPVVKMLTAAYSAQPPVQVKHATPLCKLQVTINSTYTDLALLDEGSEIVVIREDVWKKTQAPINTNARMWMQMANGGSQEMAGCLEMLEIDIEGIKTWAHADSNVVQTVKTTPCPWPHPSLALMAAALLSLSHPQAVSKGPSNPTPSYDGTAIIYRPTNQPLPTMAPQSCIGPTINQPFLNDGTSIMYKTIDQSFHTTSAIIPQQPPMINQSFHTTSQSFPMTGQPSSQPAPRISIAQSSSQPAPRISTARSNNSGVFPIPISSLTLSPFSEFLLQENFDVNPTCRTFTYKKVANKVKPVATTMPAHARIIRRFPEDPLGSLPVLFPTPPEFVPGKRLMQDRIEELGIFQNEFLWPEEQKLVAHVLTNNELALAWDETEKGRFRDDYFPPVIIPTIEHIPWTHHQSSIPPGIKEEVIKLIKSKITSGVYEASNSSYQSRWFCVAKKNGSVRIIHDLQQLNSVTVKDAATMPYVEIFTEQCVGHAIYSMMDLFVGFDH
ncbi:hypothetical protein DFH29DRAFT_1000435 [Suillus ampliporus]|nr:hypothetical protein DFH29DRAFT_1000435 [Suillus ampliporus]